MPVYDPHIMRPATGDIWHVGDWVEVIWDTAGVPRGNMEGKIVLGHLEKGSLDEHLDNDHPLAEGFQISTGSVKVFVPSVAPHDDYIIVLFGDSGNRSGNFTIAP
ncbi:hypothetical protein HWV62_38000 [Athelia sp. TMB]|nr:hypothetical protein HWV62_38000 [Athelia sp. TMB]